MRQRPKKIWVDLIVCYNLVMGLKEIKSWEENSKGLDWAFDLVEELARVPYLTVELWLGHKF